MVGFVRAGDRNGMAVAMNGTGALALVTGEYVIAERQFRNAVQFFQQTSDVSGEANASWGLGNATYAQGRRDEASEWWDKAIALYSQIGNPLADKVRTESQTFGRGKGRGETDLTNTPSEKP
jgi:tetratricopeptide (TPR) repeat protein